ncbi:MAG: insulinase family protein [Coriobacteriia bacterium]|nr:insulinase family protein [Coriobacteriia bacterium]
MHYKKTILDNGVTVLSESFSSVRSISLGIWFQVGSRDELPTEAGMSHFNEHMMFKGTPTRNALELSEAFDRLGARQNAFTSKEVTCYYADFIDESLPGIFEILSDMVLNATMDQEQCELERQVVIEEIARSEDDPEDMVYELFTQSLWPSHTLGLPIAGTYESVGSFGSKEALAYHAKHYHAGNCFVVASGNLDHEQLVALAQQYLGNMKSGGDKNSELRVVPTLYESGKFVTHKDTEQAHIMLGSRSISMVDDKRYAYQLANFIFGGSMSSRLFQEVREKLGLVYTVYSMLNPYVDSGFFTIYAGTRPENYEKVVEVAKRELDKIAQGEIRKSEHELALNAIKGSLALGLESTSQRMRMLGSSYLARGSANSFDETVAKYAAVTLDDIHAAASELAADRAVLALVGPFDDVK